jgi:hypothetical protein
MRHQRSKAGSEGVGSGEPAKPSEAPENVHREEGMDKTLADSFPASDPPSSIPDPEDEDDAA